ncbi:MULTISPECIES: cupin domain-containing protein [Paenibacillus]|uniref:YxbC n=1 Tax=Paenibacillus polymyxa (strain SC2) TaxID=886882 RepID=E3EC83_PAEPS|nr:MULTISPECIES: cupin domain-containing protein [Paenibacillus]KAF6627790.1 cupin domain-containing protein [Paenibacillus sp. EKM208P]ADO54226.1 yxbC [Paenibacillus polymyxa SC2]MCP3780908.1 cupin domain-containing protein [Paenibacillus sp. MZ03-122A]WPQ57148.1 cupin domain-containing protein [Paenibacillus polymyxa]CCC83156.1 uncharacterized protein yxbC [Paenibacillus polymyxa M1]
MSTIDKKDTVLSKVLNPFSSDIFIREHWAPSKHLVIHGNVERFHQLPGISNVQSLDNIIDLYKGPVMVVGNAVIEETGGIADRFLVSTEEAKDWYERGAALEFDFSDMFLPQLHSWMDSLRKELSLPSGSGIKAIVYAAKNGGGFKAHFDAYTNFIFHLQGTKTWKLLANENVTNPIQHYDLAEKPYIPDELATYWKGEHPQTDLPGADIVNLLPGSFLYLPRGIWHSTSSTEETLSLNITFSHPAWLELLLAEIRSRLTQHDTWRELACDINLLSPEEQESLKSKLNQELNQVLPGFSSISAEDIFKRHTEEFDIYHVTQAVFRQLLATREL